MNRNRIVRIVGWVLLAILVVSALTTLAFYWRVKYDPPKPGMSSIKKQDLIRLSENHFILGNNWLRKNKNGNWECYVEGSAYDRGRTLGILQQELMEAQEIAFLNEINEHVSSPFLRTFLLAGIAWFNRDLDKQIPEENREEIYGMSEFFSDKFDGIGPKYNRILNYHAAHDIGHAVQNMHLVGCTSFGSWSNDFGNEKMVFGRNFDFYFGDTFAKEKVVLFCKPDNGYSYVSVTWAGFSGVVSGMNRVGLGITLNSGKSEIPTKSGTPVSIIAREILQYASSIDEAIVIANKYTSFVSESFTISSATDSIIMVIEKTPEKTGLYFPEENRIIVTNHFQSKELKNLPLNERHILDSESMRRYMRVDELLSAYTTPDVLDVLSVLRDQRGLGNSDIGMGNPLAINQLLAHHAVIFKPYKRIVWVSNFPYQEGVFDAYDLNNFSHLKASEVVFPISIDTLELAADPFLETTGFHSFNRFKQLRQAILSATKSGEQLAPELVSEFLESNPAYYGTYQIAGLYFYSIDQTNQALESFRKALGKEIPYVADKITIDQLIEDIEKQ